MKSNNDKQFIWVDAYPGNVYLIKVINGMISEPDIISYSELPKYIESLRKEGFELRKYIPYFQNEYDIALKRFVAAKKHLKNAKGILKFWKKDKTLPLFLKDDIEKNTLDSLINNSYL